MPRGTQLTELEKGQIQTFVNDGQSNRWIAKQIDRSPNVVNSFVKDMDGYGKNHAGGWLPKLSPRTKRQIQAAAAQSTIGSRRLRDEFSPNVSHQTVWRAIKQSPNLVRQRTREMPSNSDSLSQETSRDAAAKQSTHALIKSVHSRPMLWDKADKNYRHAARKVAIWELVANEAGFKDGPAAMAKWGYLRGEYGKQKKKLPCISHFDDVTWPFFTSMQFLDRTSEERSIDATDTAINPIPMPVPVIIPMQDVASTSETTVRINKRKLEPEADNGTDGLDPELDNETIETQIKREKLENLKLSNCNLRLSRRLLELQIIEKERELGMSLQTEKGVQCDEWSTLIGQILR
ncbi:alcohol dehydrogenase transcription factor myb/SANT-like domain-containing protein [Ditylenchus destructor]|nr:alcohol dehydrogenase transcription factor myb/SANT-like domain-containing protein [Ditylenchus destructor]